MPDARNLGEVYEKSGAGESGWLLDSIDDIIDSSLDWVKGKLDTATANEMPVAQAEVDRNADLVQQGRTADAAAGIPRTAVPSNVPPDIPQAPGGALPTQVASAPQSRALPSVDPTPTPAMVAPEGQAPITQYGQPGYQPQDGGLPPSPERQQVQDKDADAAQFSQTIPDFPGLEKTGDFLMDKINSLGKMFEERMSKVQKVEYGKLSNQQSAMVNLRFFLSLMELGGQRGSASFLGNVGAAGRDALDARRVITEQNDRNAEARYERETKLVYDKSNLELGSFKHIADQAKWAAQLARIRGGKETVTYEKWKKMDEAERNSWAEWKNAGKKSAEDKVSFDEYLKFSETKKKHYSTWKQAGNTVKTPKEPKEDKISKKDKSARVQKWIDDNTVRDDDGVIISTKTIQEAHEHFAQVDAGLQPPPRDRMAELPPKGLEEANKIEAKFKSLSRGALPPDRLAKMYGQYQGEMEQLFSKYNIK